MINTIKPSPLIHIKNMSFVHENGKVIFENIQLEIPKGKIIAIMGPSGTGKTTLLRLIGGQLVPSSGEINLNGQIIHQLPSKALYQLRKQMGMLFQTSGLFTHLNVFENIAFPLREHTHLSESMIRILVLMKLQMVGLRGVRDVMPSTLSGGMARRVALARAIALDPQLIMYDEPFTGQDPISMGVLLRLIRTLNQSLRLTSIIVSHDVKETLSIADYVYVIVNKKIVGHGTREELINNENKELKQFLQGLPDGPIPFHHEAPDLVSDLLGESI